MKKNDKKKNDNVFHFTKTYSKRFLFVKLDAIYKNLEILSF